jgi:hypothetical protein
MKKIPFLFLFFAVLSAFTFKDVNVDKTKAINQEERISVKTDIIIIPINYSRVSGNCTYYFKGYVSVDSETGNVRGRVTVSKKCGADPVIAPEQYLADVDFSGTCDSLGNILSIDWPITGIQEVDDMLNDPVFNQDFINYVNSQN